MAPQVLQIPTRSISLPSRLHPNAIKIETDLNKLKTWEISAASNSSNSEAIQAGLIGLAELYNSVQDLIKSSSTQQALLQYHEEALEGSLELLDSCSKIQELFSSVKEHVQELQSSLRRKGGDSSIEIDLSKYIGFRKKLMKEVTKGLRKLKHWETKVASSTFPLLDLDHSLGAVIRVLREVTALTITIFRRLLMFMSWSSSASKNKAGGGGGWSLVSKLILTKSGGASAKSDAISDMGCVDLAVTGLYNQIRSHDSQVEVKMALRRLQRLDDSVDGFECGLQVLYKQLIQSRVSLLNILTH